MASRAGGRSVKPRIRVETHGAGHRNEHEEQDHLEQLSAGARARPRPGTTSSSGFSVAISSRRAQGSLRAGGGTAATCLEGRSRRDRAGIGEGSGIIVGDAGGSEGGRGPKQRPQRRVRRRPAEQAYHRSWYRIRRGARRRHADDHGGDEPGDNGNRHEWLRVRFVVAALSYATARRLQPACGFRTLYKRIGAASGTFVGPNRQRNV